MPHICITRRKHAPPLAAAGADTIQLLRDCHDGSFAAYRGTLRIHETEMGLRKDPNSPTSGDHPGIHTIADNTDGSIAPIAHDVGSEASRMRFCPNHSK
jgi:hypothetical protein